MPTRGEHTQNLRQVGSGSSAVMFDLSGFQVFQGLWDSGSFDFVEHPENLMLPMDKRDLDSF